MIYCYWVTIKFVHTTCLFTISFAMLVACPSDSSVPFICVSHGRHAIICRPLKTISTETFILFYFFFYFFF